MNSLNQLGTRQVASLNADLGKMESGDSGPGVQGQITTTLGALSRLIDDYDSMAKKEMVTAAREKAQTRVAKLKTEHASLKLRFDKAKQEGHQKSRTDLFSSSSSSTNPYSSTSQTTMRRNAPSTALPESPFAPNASAYGGPTAREDFSLREHTFLQESENSIDQYIAQGRAVLDNLVEQKGMLKGTKRRLLDTANTLGLSRETIGWVERRTKQDAWIFFAGAAFTLFSFWLIYHYLG